jgi:hypothetical protein
VNPSKSGMIITVSRARRATVDRGVHAAWPAGVMHQASSVKR